MDRLAVTFNAGSSSLKAGVFKIESGRAIRVGGGVAVLGEQPQFRYKLAEGDKFIDLHADAGLDNLAIKVITSLVPSKSDLAVVGHRIVHGGQTFSGPVLIDAGRLGKMGELISLAPLHLPPALANIRAIRDAFPEVPQTASFDTAFHFSQSSLAARLAIPRHLHDAGLRRYGFHGLSYKYISGELMRHDPDLASGRVVCAHLGSGASLCGMVDGVSIDTSMGFSALDGIPMATRPGALDPGAIIHLLRNGYDNADRLEDFLYHECGLLGVSGRSGDVRVLLEDFHSASRDAIDLFCFRVAGEIARLTVSLGGLDAIVFTAGVGEHQPEIRKGVARHLGWLGLNLSETANKRNTTVISSRDSGVTALVIPTNEEQVIADEAIGVISHQQL